MNGWNEYEVGMVVHKILCTPLKVESFAEMVSMQCTNSSSVIIYV